MCVGDGLSVQRYCDCEGQILDHLGKFDDKYERALVINKALERMVMIPGDLHAIFLLFYGGLIQPIQVALNWKQIDSRKVEKTYHQCSFLVLMVLDLFEQQLYNAIIDKLRKEKADELNARMSCSAVDLAQYLRTNILHYLKDRLLNSTDEVFRQSLNFIHIART